MLKCNDCRSMGEIEGCIRCSMLNWRDRAEALQAKGEEVTHHLGVAMMDARLLEAERDELAAQLRMVVEDDALGLDEEWREMVRNKLARIVGRAGRGRSL